MISFGSTFIFHSSFMARDTALSAFDQFAASQKLNLQNVFLKIFVASTHKQAVVVAKETQRLEAAM